MPRIPDYTAAGTSVPRTTTPRFNPDRSRAIVAEGQGALLTAVDQAVDQAVEHDDKLRYATARGSLLRAQIEARKELEGDPNYETYETRFRERTAKARSDAASGIRGPRSRELFEADAQADIERGVEQIRAQARGVEVDQNIASANSDLEANRTAALESKDPIERGALVQNSLDKIDGLLRKGYIKASEAQAQRERFQANYGEAFVRIQTPAEQIALLEKPDTNVAKFIDPLRRKELLEAAKRDDDEVRVRGESQAVFDNLMAKHGTNFRAALNEARAELKKDPKLRDATETRISQEQYRVETFERDDAAAAYQESLEFLQSGGPGGTPGKLPDLPLDLQRRLKPGSKAALKNVAITGGRTVSDPEALLELSQLARDPENFARNVDMSKYIPLLTAGDLKSYLDAQRQLITGGLDAKVAGVLSIDQTRDNKLVQFFGGVRSTKKGESGRAEQGVINDFVTKFQAQLKLFKQQNGGNATSEDATKILDQMWSEVVISEGNMIGYGEKKKRVYELTDQDVDVPAKDRDQIIEALRAEGTPVTPKEMRRLFEKNRAKMFEKPAP